MLTGVDNALFEDNAIGERAAISYQYKRVLKRGHKAWNQLDYGTSAAMGATYLSDAVGRRFTKCRKPYHRTLL